MARTGTTFRTFHTSQESNDGQLGCVVLPIVATGEKQSVKMELQGHENDVILEERAFFSLLAECVSTFSQDGSMFAGSKYFFTVLTIPMETGSNIMIDR